MKSFTSKILKCNDECYNLITAVVKSTAELVNSSIDSSDIIQAAGVTYTFV